MQSKIRIFASNSSGSKAGNSSTKAKDKENAEISSDISASEVMISMTKKKNTNILNYFSKTTVSKAKAKARKVTNIDVFDKVSESVESNDVATVKVCVDEDRKRTDKSNAVKLAPLFQRRLNTVDPQVRKARLEFLQNGLPTNIRKIKANKKNPEEGLFRLLFPAISHVQQKDDDPLWESASKPIPLLSDKNHHYEFSENAKIFRFKITNDINHTSEIPRTLNNNAVVNLKSKCKDSGMESMFNSYKRKKDDYLKKLEELNESFDNFSDIVEVFDYGDGFNSLWTEIYKPRSSEIMGNNQTVHRLTGWLKTWKEYNNEVKNLRKSKENKDSDDDSDVFVSSDDENIGLRAPGNVCLLSGPVASGKTSLVYALAAELDYNVLEVNASSKRTGKCSEFKHNNSVNNALSRFN